MVDTSVLGLVWLHERDGGGAAARVAGRARQALGLPAHRPHDALGDALTTAQVFIALATHLDARRPETVGRLVAGERRLESLFAYPSR